MYAKIQMFLIQRTDLEEMGIANVVGFPCSFVPGNCVGTYAAIAVKRKL